MTEPWTREQVAEAYRTATAIAAAGARGDPDAVAALWQGCEHKQSLLWALSRVPGALVQAVLAERGVDASRALSEMTRVMATWQPEDDTG